MAFWPHPYEKGPMEAVMVRDTEDSFSQKQIFIIQWKPKNKFCSFSFFFFFFFLLTVSFIFIPPSDPLPCLHQIYPPFPSSPTSPFLCLFNSQNFFSTLYNPQCSFFLYTPISSLFPEIWGFFLFLSFCFSFKPSFNHLLFFFSHWIM